MNRRIEQVWRDLRCFGLLALAAVSLAACATPKYETSRPVAMASAPTRGGAPRAGSTVGRDGKPLRGTEKPYQINGIWYYPGLDKNYNVTGIGSWYGDQFHNRRTANGEIFDMNIPSAAHKTLPLPSLVEVTNLDTGKKMIVRVNDRGPFVGDRVIDLSKAAAQELGYYRQGTARVRVKYVGPAPKNVFEAPRQYSAQSAPPPAPPRERSFDDIKEPTQRVQVIPSRREPDPDWSAAPIQQSVATPDRVFASAKPYRVQAGSFSSRENAEKAVRQLSGAGQATIDAIERASGTLYRVTVSAGQNEGEAWSLRQRVESMGYQGATVLRP